MKTPSRLLLDAYNALTAWRGRPKMAEVTPETGLREQREIIPSGTWTDANDLARRVTDDPAGNQFSFAWKTASLQRLSNVWLTGDQGQVYLSDGSLFKPWLAPYEHVAERIKLRRPLPVGARVIDGPVFHLTGRNHENRGHFMLQYLPRLMAAREYLKQLPDHRILVAPGHSRWQQRYLAWLGFEPERVIEGTQGTMLVRDLIFIPQLYGKAGLCPPRFYQELCAAAAAFPTNNGPGRPVFITRRDAPDKRLLNEERIIELLRARVGKVDVIELGRHSLPEQIGIFRTAPLVIGPIGQGICNALFCQRSMLVVLAPGTSGAEVYNSSHGVQLARMCGSEGLTFLSNEPAPSRGDWSFPEDRFVMLLDRLLQQPEASSLKTNAP